ncbi:MAG: double-strand break repair protein AddB [Parvularculaceae bacterium]
MRGPGPADIFGASLPRVFSIDAGRPFLLDLARALHETGDPLALADMTIFLPTRRAVRALHEAFAATSGGASLLPRLRALGDIDEDEFALSAPSLEAEAIDLLPSVSLVERRLVLARFVSAADRAFAGQENWPGALGAADELGKLLDSFHAEEIAFARLADAAPADHAEHWSRSLKFLEIVTKLWPDYLAGRGLIDPGERRARLIALQAERLEKTPPARPVIVAGTTGSAPAVARLMRVVARLAKGAVVLPGLDRALVADKKAWGAVDDPHSQAGLKAVLDALGVDAATVSLWPAAPAPTTRNALLSLALRPAEATDDWRALVAAATRRDPEFGEARAGLEIVEAADEDAEASAVAILMREALEAPDRSAMLVTPDRNLGRRVAAKLRRWRISIDDSAGTPFANSPCGTYLRLVARWLVDPSDPVALLSLARHPLSGFGVNAARRIDTIAALDKGLRGPAPGRDFDGLAGKLAADEKLAAKAAFILDAFRRALALWPRDDADIADFLDAHIAAAEALASSDEEAGAARLWRGDDGEMGATVLAELKATAEALGRVAAADYAESFSELIAGTNLRNQATHPRLQILGPLEARLQSADLVILGGLNEGQWPADATIDPFLSRRMRADLGLPSPERRLGLSAHDFAQLAAAPSVALTRARQAGGAPAKPSRWIVRLKNILGEGAWAAIDATSRLAAWSTALDRPAAVKRATPPKPKPPVEARPRKLYVTRFEDLMRDPYSVYARDILKLRALDKLAEPFGPAQLGRLLHAVFADFAKAEPSPEPRAALGAILDRLAADYGLDDAASAFWRPRLDASLDWFLDWDRERRLFGAPAVIEGSGEHAFDVAGKPFTLAARADRIDLLLEGGAALFDYKSGQLKTLSQIKADFSPQLPLTALIVEAGVFSALGPRPVSSFNYVKALNQKSDGKDFSGAEGDEARAIIEEARKGFTVLVAHYDDPDTVYLSQPRPEFLNKYADFDHLARRREWAAAEDGE